MTQVLAVRAGATAWRNLAPETIAAISNAPRGCSCPYGEYKFKTFPCPSVTDGLYFGSVKITLHRTRIILGIQVAFNFPNMTVYSFHSCFADTAELRRVGGRQLGGYKVFRAGVCAQVEVMRIVPVDFLRERIVVSFVRFKGTRPM